VGWGVKGKNVGKSMEFRALDGAWDEGLRAAWGGQETHAR